MTKQEVLSDIKDTIETECNIEYDSIVASDKVVEYIFNTVAEEVLRSVKPNNRMEYKEDFSQEEVIGVNYLHNSIKQKAKNLYNINL